MTKPRALLVLIAVCAAAHLGCARQASDADPDAQEAILVTAADGSVLGSVTLQVNCGAGADEHLLRGVALYHNMTFTEAEAEFRSAAEVEPECALGYWGAAASFVHTLWPDTVDDERVVAGRELLERARAATIRSARDDTYIAAFAGYYDDAENRSEQDRLESFRVGWGAAHEANPDDLEAQAFYALALLATAPADPAYPHQNQAGALLAEILTTVPNHPGGLHYTIHAYDFPPLAERALPVAHSYGAVIPENSHALHMTSHIFTRLGHWPDSIAYNRRAADVAAKHPMGGLVSHHYLHALDYLAYAYLQQGEDAAALEAIEELRSLGEMHESSVTAYAVAAMPVRLALDAGNWDVLPAGEESIDASKYPAFAAMPVFATGMRDVQAGDLGPARAAERRLAELGDAARSMAGAYDWSTQVEIQRLTLQSWIEYAGGDAESALGTAEAAAELASANPKSPVTPGVVRPARESYADMLFALGRFDEAAAQYAATLETSPGRFRSLLGAGDSARLAGDLETARTFYAQLLEIAAGSDRAEIAGVREHMSD